MSQWIGGSVVLFLSLYGVVCLLHKLSLLLLRPQNVFHSFSLAFLSENTQNAEQIIRYFRLKAAKEDVLLLIDNGVLPHEKQVVERMCATCPNVRFLNIEKNTQENCFCEDNAV